MGHEIPEPFVWDESFKVFYDHLDNQHKGLFQAIFDVGNSPSDTHTLSTLVNLMQEHFEHEEHDMKKAKFDGLDHHKHAHDEFLKSLRAVSTPVPGDKVVWAKEWLVNHIKAIDALYSGKL